MYPTAGAVPSDYDIADYVNTRVNVSERRKCHHRSGENQSQGMCLGN